VIIGKGIKGLAKKIHEDSERDGDKMALDGKENSSRENSENSRPSVKINCTDLVLLAQDLLVAAGADVSNAKAAAEIFVEADLRGMGVQGVDYVYYVLDCLKRGIIDGKAKPTIERQTDSTALIDGNRGLGQPAALTKNQMAKPSPMNLARRCTGGSSLREPGWKMDSVGKVRLCRGR